LPAGSSLLIDKVAAINVDAAGNARAQTEVLQKADKRMTFQLAEQKAASKSELYAHLVAQLRSLLAGERDFIANTANCAALLFNSLPDLNWSGFYFLKGGELVLGPFQGQPASVRIAMGKGVCGTAAARRETVLVANVHDFPGHIACDSASNSEIVVPLVKDDRLIGVLDLDSPLFGRFDDEDARGLNELAEILTSSADFQMDEQMAKS
jgi:L-methionine (R)-S-oxide reductase